MVFFLKELRNICSDGCSIRILLSSIDGKVNLVIVSLANHSLPTFQGGVAALPPQTE